MTRKVKVPNEILESVDPSALITGKPPEQRFAIFGKDAFSNFKERRIECVSLPEAKRHAELWWKNGGQDVRIVVEEARPGIVWQEVSSERIH